MARFTLYINFQDRIAERPLPAENDRKLFVDLAEYNIDCKILFEVFDNKWTIFSCENYSMQIRDNLEEQHTLSDGDMIKIHTSDEKSFVIMVYEINGNITDFSKYSIKEKNIIKIGKAPDCDISINSPYISTEHAVIEKNGARWVYRDTSLNGSYINSVRVSGQCELKMTDIISSVGIKIVFLGDRIAVNRKDITVCRLGTDNISSEITEHTVEDEFFSRSPRIAEPLFDDVIEIETPPAPQSQKNQPLIFVIGPSVTMPLPILMSTFINSQISGGSSRSYLAMIASVGMSAFIGASWAVAHYLYNRKTLKNEEKNRISAYNEYIKKNELLIREKQNYDNSILIGQYLSSADIAERMKRENSFIWNRNVNQDDFLTIRLGTGNVDFGKHISVPKQRFSLINDEMAELPHSLYEKYKYIKDAVVTVDLKQSGIIGIIGTRDHIGGTLMNVMIQISALHCYTDVRMAFFFNENEYSEYSRLRWLPHFSSEDMKLRMIACDRISRQNVLYHIDEVLRRRTEFLNEDSSRKSILPHYVVICTDRDIFDGDSIEKYISMAEQLGFTFILAYGRLDKLPNECSRIIQCDSDFTGVYDLKSKRGNTDRVLLDSISAYETENLARALSRLRVREYSTGEIPSSINYFDMIGIGRVEHWDLIKKYKENRIYEGIKSFVGIGIGGKPIYIDIHEKKHGPHGLVAGTTGSGKSETLQTFIISLALNYHPDEIAFILIDYKGGGMALAFEGMPHIAGMITNLGGENDTGKLDNNITRRALISIRSEIKRRQTIFNKYKVNHIDSYIRLYRDGAANEPLPHLVIISDEFAELKKEQPDFIKELVSTARVGRSLGIHLILATQKPGGVVDDEIRSNSRFKLCLRVQDKQDSIEMLKRPEAAYLTQSGRAYFQLGNDEVFEQFQTGYSGADYFTREEVGADADSELYMMNIDGTAAVARERMSSKLKSGVKQLKAAVDYISSVCASNRIRPTRALWIEELSEKLYLNKIEGTFSQNYEGVSAVFGMIDDPEHQSQFPAVIDLSACSNLLICGISGSGKSTLLQTMLVSLTGRYSCEQLNFYILDFSSRTLKQFSRSRHCGMVAFSDDKEAVSRLIKHIKDEINRRRKLFDDANVGGYSEYTRISALPLMLVIVDNFYSFNELYPELSESFSMLARDCAKYGVQIIITCNNVGDIRYKLRQSFLDSLTLLLAEKSDYREILGVSADFVPKNTKGRGLILFDGRLLEFQTALPCEGENESERYNVITNMIEKVNDRDIGLKAAEQIKTIPLSQSYEEFLTENQREDMLPIGYNTEDISVYGIEYTKTFCYAVSEIGTRGISLVLNNIIFGAKNAGATIDVIRLKNDIKINTELADNVYRDKNSVCELIYSLRETFNKRAIDKKKFLADEPDGDFAEYLCGKYGKRFLIIDSMSEFLNAVYDTANEKQIYTFAEAYFKNGFGMGLYFIAGFDAAVYGTDYYRPACKLFAEYKKGIHLGGRFDKQKFVDVNMTMSQMSKQTDPFMGISNDNGGEMKIFIPGGKEE